MARQQLGNSPANAPDTATKGYVDSRYAPIVPVFVQQADPGLSSSYIWYQVDASNNLVTVWLNVVSNSANVSGTDLYLMV